MVLQERAPRPGIGTAANILEIIYHATVRNVRKTHGNALYGLVMNIVQTLIMVAVFYFMYSVLGTRGAQIRGDFLIYIMSGIFLYMTHVKGMGSVAGSEGPASPMMQHAPMSTAVAISSAALAGLYIQVLSAAAVLFGYDLLVAPVHFANTAGVIAMFFLAWISGVATGLVVLAAKPWAPEFFGLFTTLYQRANMIASGKMFVANSLPGYMLVMFSWNPLFHCIDQARGFAFVNYNPHYSSITYPVIVTIALLMIGLMGEFFTRKHASASWSARH